jgi:hypothetical protein
VARILDRRTFSNAGFTLTADIGHGVHTLWVRARSALSGVWGMQQVRFIVGAAPRVGIPTPALGR